MYILFWILRQLHLILSILLQRDEGAKSEVATDKEKDIISTITSLFQSIKLSEDTVDTSKTKVENNFVIT
jgi:sister-chromatid-cohesion protein PDS5